MTSNHAVLGLFVLVPLLGCGAAPKESLAPDLVPTQGNAVVKSCARSSPPLGKSLDVSGASSTVALVRAAGRTIAYVADEDDSAVRTIDVEMAGEIAVTPLGGVPASLLVLGDGRIVASLRDRSSLVVLEAEGGFDKPLRERCNVSVPAEPAGLALSPDSATLFVASRWDHALTALAAADMAPRFNVDLPRDPYAVVASSDGKKVFVSHVAGSRISVVDVEGDHRARSINLHDYNQRRHVRGLSMDSGREFRESTGRVETRDQHADQGYALVRTSSGHILAPEAMVDTGNGVRSSGYGDGRSAFGDIAAISDTTEKRLVRPAFDGVADDCLLPRGASIDADDQKLVVACFGLNAIVAYDAKSLAPHNRELRRYSVGGGPTGVAVDDSHRAVVWSKFDRRLTIVDLKRRVGNAVTAIGLDPLGSTMSLAVLRGRALFHASGDRRISFDGRACASCHPDGRDDGLTWTTPEGPRQTPMLADRVEATAPYGWTGASRNIDEHMKHTFDRLAGKGITPAEQGELFAYVATLKTPGSEREGGGPVIAASLRSAPRPSDSPIARGDVLFHSEATGCSTCHLGDELTDHVTHDVKSRAIGDAARAFDTPSLRWVGRSAPYDHDGRYATLGDLLRGTDGKMGHTSQLSLNDRDDLVAYLESL